MLSWCPSTLRTLSWLWAKRLQLLCVASWLMALAWTTALEKSYQDSVMKVYFGTKPSLDCWRLSWPWLSTSRTHASWKPLTAVAWCWFMLMTHLWLDEEVLYKASWSSALRSLFQFQHSLWRSLVMSWVFSSAQCVCNMLDTSLSRPITSTSSIFVSFSGWIHVCRTKRCQVTQTWARSTTPMTWTQEKLQSAEHALECCYIWQVTLQIASMLYLILQRTATDHHRRAWWFSSTLWGT